MANEVRRVSDKGTLFTLPESISSADPHWGHIDSASLDVFAVIALTSEALVVPYVIAALHCVYGGTWASAIFRGIAALVGNITVVFAVTIVVGIAAVLTLL